MVIFHSYVKLPEGILYYSVFWNIPNSCCFHRFLGLPHLSCFSTQRNDWWRGFSSQGWSTRGHRPMTIWIGIFSAVLGLQGLCHRLLPPGRCPIESLRTPHQMVRFLRRRPLAWQKPCFENPLSMNNQPNWDKMSMCVVFGCIWIFSD